MNKKKRQTSYNKLYLVAVFSENLHANCFATSDTINVKRNIAQIKFIFMEGEQHFSPETKEKPPFLYHASANREIEKFEPRAESFRDPEEGSVVFATPDKAYASMFIVPVDDSWTQIATLEGGSCIVISDKKRFEELDKGGAIYSVSSETSETDPKKSKTGREWTSAKTISSSEKTVYESGLEAMIENGVQVYFVDKSTFEKIQVAEDCGLSILRTLESENQKRGKNVVEFKDEK